MENHLHITRQSIWKLLMKSRSVMISLIFLSVLMFVSLFASFIVNDQPITCVYNGERVFPVFTPEKIDSVYVKTSNTWKVQYYKNIDWKEENISSVIWPLIPYSYDRNRSHKLFSPFKKQSVKKETLKGLERHHLGTDRSGRDVLAGVIYGARTSLSVGIVAVLLACIIGIFIGALAGYFGDHSFKLSRGKAYLFIPGLLLAWFYGFRVRRFELVDAFSNGLGTGLISTAISLIIAVLIVAFFLFLGKQISQKNYFSKSIYFPVDSIIMRLIEIINSIPSLLLIISIAAILGRSLWIVMLIIGLTSWTGVARLVRAEMLKISKLEYIQSARALGIKRFHILFRHALPNALTPVWVVMAFGIGNAIIAESGLSFLHIIENDTTWGNMLSAGRENMNAWWISVFPGLAIFFTVLSFNLLGERLRDILDPKI